MSNGFPFSPHDRLKQFGFREIPVDLDKIFMSNGSVGASWTEVTLNKTPQVFIILNTHSSQYLRFSTNGGTTYFTLFPQTGLKVGTKGTSFHLYGENADTTYDIIGFEID